MIAIALVLLTLGAALYLLSQRRHRASGLPEGQVIYSDTGDWQRNDHPLFSNRYRLVGKPDYLVRQGGEVIPVEVKSTRLRGRPPFQSHKMQLAAYCLLVEDVMGVRPSYGILKYADDVIRIEYTDPMRRQLLATLDEMRRAMHARDIHRSHDDPARCRFCGYRESCDQALST